MLPLTLATVGEKYKIRRIGGSDRVRHHLMELGFVVEAYVSVLSSVDGNLIVKIKDSRVAVSGEMAARIMV
ncbi:MAG: ferrous iron transport protein A [Kiritimatiellae bacterium]|nr:ferrous iron transport protein A [Kiritimatiellia bacterium]